MKAYLKRKKNIYELGKRVINNKFHKEGERIITMEHKKSPYRYELINFLLNFLNRETKYLEIGVRFPQQNFDLIVSKEKYSVDPGYENPKNPVDFKVTSDVFFEDVREGKILQEDILFDVIFIDGLHLADQVERDIKNSLSFLKEDGYIVMHDCNPPSEFHASENHNYKLSPAKGYWNGTTWKAFFKQRQSKETYSCCIDSDWGIGVISKSLNLGKPTKINNPYFEFNVFNENRKESLNLISYKSFQKKIL
ncbi:class I SAM-dependent methyltransferase [Tenacibaculum aquimarinum]|uniref:class I SAM-dependent methyltransferase n=1 Tax=Tenacibaculum aquimarinum TaxID=2910675 RepID=UPI001F0A0AA8|nr:class I SAM-dependent methyltransferase [Tenacibaculum aquimarinum]MCH3881938.1 class I SAM-dependent methyltransferase [Tenacibaculum aquimarinum]